MQKRDDRDRNYDFGEIELDPRLERCEYEMKLTFGSWLIYAFATIGLSYYLSRGGVDYIHGMPSWFFWGECVTAFVFFLVVCYMVLKVFRNMDLFDR